MIVPTSAAFLPEPYFNMSSDQRRTINHVYDSITQFTTKMITVDAYSVLERHRNEYIYFRSDHHWTALGAYYAYTAFCQAAGLAPVPLSDYNIHRAEGFIGFLYNQRPTQSIADNPDTIVYYTLSDPAFRRLILHPGETPTYMIFMGGDHAYFSVDTQNKNGRTVVVLKDSYANCFIPFLVPHYERIVVLDPRHLPNDFSITAEVNGYDDVDFLIMNYVFTTTFSDILYVMNLKR
jgi:hypothetical protein